MLLNNAGEQVPCAYRGFGAQREFTCKMLALEEQKYPHPLSTFYILGRR